MMGIQAVELVLVLCNHCPLRRSGLISRSRNSDKYEHCEVSEF